MSTAASEATEHVGSTSTSTWSTHHMMLGWLVVALGTALRLRQYVADRSLWRDEAMFVFNLTHRGLSGFTRPLDFAQGAQPGFYIVEHLAGTIGGETSLGYRFVPLVAGAVTLVLALLLARRELQPVTGLVALTLLATSSGLIYFSTEVKPYGLDACLTIAILLTASMARQRSYDRASCIALGVVGAGSLLFSFAATFVLAGVGAAMAFDAHRSSARHALRRLAVVGATWAAEWIVLFVFIGRHVAENSFFKETLPDAFLAIPPTNGVEVDRWRLVVMTYFEQLAVNHAIWILGPVAVVGLVTLLRRRPGLVGVLVLPWFLAVVASSFQLYPVAERHMLWMLPTLAVLIGAGTDLMASALAERSRALAAVPIAIVLVVGASAAPARFVDPPELEELGPLVARIAEEQRPGDVVYVSTIAETAYDFYARDHGVDLPVLRGEAPVDDPEAVATEIASLKGRPRVWVASTAWWHDPGEIAPGVEAAFDRLGTRVESIEAPGAVVYLYDLSGPASEPASGRN